MPAFSFDAGEYSLLSRICHSPDDVTRNQFSIFLRSFKQLLSVGWAVWPTLTR